MNLENIYKQFENNGTVTGFGYTRLIRALEIYNILTGQEVRVEDFLTDDSLKLSLIQVLGENDEGLKVLDYKLLLGDGGSINFKSFVLKILDLQSEKIKNLVDNIKILFDGFIVNGNFYIEIYILKTGCRITMISKSSLGKMFEILNMHYDGDNEGRLNLYNSLLNGYNTGMSRLSLQNRNKRGTDIVEENRNSTIFLNYIVDGLEFSIQEILKKGENNFFENLKSITLIDNKSYSDIEYVEVVKIFTILANYLRINFTSQNLNHHTRNSISSFLEIFLGKYTCYSLELGIGFDVILKSICEFSFMKDISFFSVYVKRFVLSDMFTNELCIFLSNSIYEGNIEIVNDIIFNYLKRGLSSNDLGLIYEKIISDNNLKNLFISNLDKFGVYESMYLLFRICLHDCDSVLRINNFEKLSIIISGLVENEASFNKENINTYINLFDMMIILFLNNGDRLWSRFIKNKLSLLYKYRKSLYS